MSNAVFRDPIACKGGLIFATALMLFVIDAMQVGVANMVGVDSRRSILDRQKRLGLDITDADADRFGKATGYIDCRGRTHSNPDLGSAALVGAENLLVTNAHLLIDEFQRFREPMEECFFQPQTSDTARYRLSFAPGSFEIIRDWPALGGHADYAVVRLEKRVSGAKAFRVDTTGAQLSRGKSFVAVSAISYRSHLFDPLYPVIQGCQVMQIQPQAQMDVTSFLGDCDVEPGQSGSINLLNVAGEWIAIGMIAGGGPPESEGREFSLEKKSYSFHVAFRGKLLEAINRLSRS